MRFAARARAGGVPGVLVLRLARLRDAMNSSMPSLALSLPPSLSLSMPAESSTGGARRSAAADLPALRVLRRVCLPAEAGVVVAGVFVAAATPAPDVLRVRGMAICEGVLLRVGGRSC